MFFSILNSAIYIHLYLWKNTNVKHEALAIIINISDTSRAQSTAGTLSRKTSGSGPYLFRSGTRSWTSARDMVVRNQLAKQNTKAVEKKRNLVKTRREPS